MRIIIEDYKDQSRALTPATEINESIPISIDAGSSTGEATTLGSNGVSAVDTSGTTVSESIDAGSVSSELLELMESLSESASEDPEVIDTGSST